jgi:hypothetical protein
MTSSVSPGNWTAFVQDFVKGKETANYIIGTELIGSKKEDPFVGCAKDFSATYQCGNSSNIKSSTTKTINIPGEAGGKSALFDCSAESKKCKALRLTLGDDGNLVLSDAENKQIWTSNTNKVGLVVDKFNAKNSKYGRNYLLAGETLKLGEFIGSPSGNCYLLMDRTSDGNALQLKYSVLNCTDEQYGEDETTDGLFSLAKSAYNELMNTSKKVTPEMKRLGKSLNKLAKEEGKKNHMDHNVKDYVDIQNTRPIINKQMQQLDAMNEDRELFLVRYKYRRIAWVTLAILVVLAGIKLARNNS